MFLLTLKVALKWDRLSWFLERYGSLFASGRLGEISFPFEFDNQMNTEYFPRDDAFGVVVNISSKGVNSETVLLPHVQSATIDIKPRTKVEISGENAMIENEQFQPLVISHIRMLLTILAQIDNNKFIRLFENLRQRDFE